MMRRALKVLKTKGYDVKVFLAVIVRSRTSHEYMVCGATFQDSPYSTLQFYSTAQLCFSLRVCCHYITIVNIKVRMPFEIDETKREGQRALLELIKPRYLATHRDCSTLSQQ